MLVLFFANFTRRRSFRLFLWGGVVVSQALSIGREGGGPAGLSKSFERPPAGTVWCCCLMLQVRKLGGYSGLKTLRR